MREALEIGTATDELLAASSGTSWKMAELRNESALR